MSLIRRRRPRPPAEPLVPVDAKNAELLAGGVVVVLSFVESADGEVPILCVPDRADLPVVKRWLTAYDGLVVRALRARQARDN